MLVEIGRQIPYLTGETREIVADVLGQVDQQIKKLIGKRRYKNKLPLETTLRKTSRGVYPRYSSNLYSVKYTRTYRKNWGKIESRGDWRDYLEATIAKTGTGIATFNGIIVTGSSSAKFIFALNVDHWEKYDTGIVSGKPSKGPWHVVQDGIKIFNQTFDEGLPKVLKAIAAPFTIDVKTGLIKLESI